MIAEKILSARSALGILAGRLTEEERSTLILIRAELADAAAQAARLENSASVPAENEADAAGNETEERDKALFWN